MSLSVLACITCAYGVIMVTEIVRGNADQAIIYGGYAFANIGLMMGMR